MLKKLTREELVDMLPEGSLLTVERWLARGDGVAVYENQALDSSGRGSRKFLSFGSSAALLEGEEPPARMPDISGHDPGWKYGLVAVYRGV